MDKAILKKFAIESRQDLMSKIKNKINTYYIDEEFTKEQKGDLYILSNSKHSLSLTNEEYKKRELLIKRIKELSIEQVIEEAAYTWFNRIIAIRYMEINDMLPLTRDNQSLGIRVLSSKDNTPDPEILKFTNLVNPELDIEFKKEKYAELKDDNEKFKYILLLVCKKLGKVIPQVFDGVTDYIDILIPDNLLNDTGFVNKIINEVKEENYNQVEIIGWLYQYYISEKKDEVFAELKKSKKINKENIPAATQLFTPDWIVKYLVENTLGKILVSINSNFKKELKYYIENEKTHLKNKYEIEKVKFIDPCCGSGHILVYAFEILYKFYKELGYSKNKIAKMIINNNLYGIDIDDRACQLTVLSLSLKAREYDKEFFVNENDYNIISIQETNKISELVFDEIKDENNKEVIEEIRKTFIDAKEYGSIIDIKENDYDKLLNSANSINNIFAIEVRDKVIPIIKQAKLLSQKYDVVVTNPPYMGNKGMSIKLFNYIKKYYNDSKLDFFAVFIERCRKFVKEDSFYGMITQPSFVVLSSFEKLRRKIIEEQTITSMLHMGRGIFGVDFGSVAFTIQNRISSDFEGDYFRLYQRTFQYIESSDIEDIYLKALKEDNFKFNFYKYNNSEYEEESPLNKSITIRFSANQNDFKQIPTNPFAYWCSKKLLDAFSGEKVHKYATPRQGLATTDNNRFLRFWYELKIDSCNFNCKSTQEASDSGYKWFPIVKGGDYRKWYGNRIYMVNYENDGLEMKQSVLTKYPYLKTPNFVIKNPDYYFKEGITWSTISSRNISMRYNPSGSIFETKGAMLFPIKKEYKNYLLGLLNSKVSDLILDILCPTMDFHEGPIGNFPIIYNDNEDFVLINKLVDENIEIMKEDWNDYEISWDFELNPLLKHKGINIKESLDNYIIYLDKKIELLKQNEEKLNEIFIKIYSLEDELNNRVADEELSLIKPSSEQIIKNFLSYFIGCLFGRYSLDEKGLIYAGDKFNNMKYKRFEADLDNILPITDEPYFKDDIIDRFKIFLEIIYGKQYVNENVDLIAEILGKKGTETSEDTLRRYFINDFYNDHIKMYQKHPIYWLFDSGKKNGFKALVYMHRYNENLIPKVRLDYLHRIQTTYEKLLSDINYKLTTELSMLDKKTLQNKQIDLNAKLQEIKEYDEKIAHIANQRISIDLDDGVKENYDKFKDILAKIK